MKRNTIIAANWKMNGNLTLIQNMAAKINSCDIDKNVKVIICPSFPYLLSAEHAFDHDNVMIGAQNISEYSSGAYTGEVSAQMLTEMSISYVILGHSERRRLYQETSDLVADKIQAALSAGVKPILCIGENEEERGSLRTKAVLSAQLQPVVDKIGIEKFKDVVIGYEPTWAVGTGKTASPEVAQETHAFIRSFLAKLDANIAAQIPIIYGGSVNENNCENLFAQTDIDGGLIGGVGLKVDEFSKICSTIKG